jgi:uncharacterized protein with FMN-binding domain
VTAPTPGATDIGPEAPVDGLIAALTEDGDHRVLDGDGDYFRREDDDDDFRRLAIFNGGQVAGRAPEAGVADAVPAAPGAQPTPAIVQPPAPTGTPATTLTQVPTATTNLAATTPGAQAAPAQGQFHDGTYTGPAANASYGMVQVQAVIRNGVLTAVNILDYPSHTRRSQRINDAVLPRLQSEAIRAQTASVSVISGATLTVRAFRQSLAQALSAARA